MKQCRVLVGLPGSGKSTLAEKYKEDGFKVFSRDQARLDNPGMKESEISNLEREFVLEGYNKILIDNTHMNPSSLDKIVLFCRGNGYDVEVVDMRYHINTIVYSGGRGLIRVDYQNELYELNNPLQPQVYLSVCLERNSKREGYKRVPDSVIYQMYLQNYEFVDDKKGYVIVDVDGTIADLSHRLHYYEETPKNHDAFYNEVDKDAPIEKVIDIVRYLSQKHFIVITSGRRNQCCEKTVERLKKHNVPYDALLMRGSFGNREDRRPDTEVKKEIYDKCLANKDIIMSIDDRPCVVELWRSLGIFTIDVNQRGNF